MCDKVSLPTALFHSLYMFRRVSATSSGNHIELQKIVLTSGKKSVVSSGAQNH